MPDLLPMSPDQGRRRLLRCLAAAPAALLGGQFSLAAGPSWLDGMAPRILSMVSTHTRERQRACYFDAGAYLPDGLACFDHLLRDHRTGDVAAIDPQLYDQLHELARRANSAPHYEIISGYRSPASNEKLRRGSSGVAQKSLHMEGRAIDVRLPGVSCARLRDLAIGMQRGGVGYYPKSDFVHLDTGRVRAWSG